MAVVATEAVTLVVVVVVKVLLYAGAVELWVSDAWDDVAIE